MLLILSEYYARNASEERIALSMQLLPSLALFEVALPGLI